MSYWVRWRLKSPASPLFTQPFIQVQIKGNVKTGLCHWPLCGEFIGGRWIPRTNGQQRGKCFHLMTSSWWRESISCRWVPSQKASNEESNVQGMTISSNDISLEEDDVFAKVNWWSHQKTSWILPLSCSYHIVVLGSLRFERSLQPCSHVYNWCGVRGLETDSVNRHIDLYPVRFQLIAR